MSSDYDLVIRGGRILDGAGNPWFPGDVGIRDGKIAAIGTIPGKGARELDATGRYVVPGFIDVHAHSDFALTIHPEAESQLGQGITTEVIGNCGFSAYPRNDRTRRLMFDPEGVDGSWTTPEDYLRTLASRPLGDNVVSLLGHGTIRHAVMSEQDRAATPEEIEQMQKLIREAMLAGSAGLSTGLDYVPGIYASTPELVELCRVVAEFGGVYASHLRGYTNTVLESVKEAIAIGEESGCSVQLSHMDVFGRDNWGIIDQVIGAVNAARDRGVDVTADMMAFPTAGSWWAPRAVFPPGVYDYLAPARQAQADLQEKLRDPAYRADMRARVEAQRVQSKKGFDEELLMFSTWQDIILTGTAPGSPNASDIGKDLQTLAAERGAEPVDVFFDLLVEEGEDLSSVRISVNEDEYRRLCSEPWVMFGTDSIATADRYRHEPFNTIMSHPRHYVNSIRVLTHHVFEKGWLSFPDAVRKMTSLPARRFGLGDRGLVAEGMAADLLVLNTESLAEVATWLDPRQHPSGVDYVVVNGVVTLDHGRFTGDLGGRPLLSAAATR
ncbi:N-acyl-D-amino-acid deacylase family protein [Amycolatopsis jejuensis]|uniref:N-acyl-D-amino-acid deacylase family protein n=1 Tax=Amycolatopsis jejuensis TaxID=330084 RepID=UPI00052647FA|nr:D-aminoacylase [Amycolatopsis jejuensis]